MTKYSKGPILKVVGSTLACICGSLLLGAFLVWAIVRPYGKPESEVSEDFWNLKVKMAQVYAKHTGDDYFVQYPEDVLLLKNDDGTYWAYFRGPLFNSDGGESYKITNEDDKRVIDNEIN